MRKLFALLALLATFTTGLKAQSVASVVARDTLPPITKPARDFVLLQFGYANWISRPDSIKTKTFGYAFNAFLCYDFPIKKTKMSFAAGLGISTTSVYLDNQVLVLDDTGSRGYQAYVQTDSIKDYKRYKFNTAYISAPFELRYFSNTYNRNKGFKAAIGMQVGTLLSGHTKGLRGVDGSNIKDKVTTKRYLTPWNFAATARIGWGNMSVFASYNLTPVFKDNVGPPITPMTVGICLSGL